MVGGAERSREPDMLDSPLIGRHVTLTHQGHGEVTGTVVGVGETAVPGRSEAAETNWSLLLVADNGTLMALHVHRGDWRILGWEPPAA
jgi:hypothetical protein